MSSQVEKRYPIDLMLPPEHLQGGALTVWQEAQSSIGEAKSLRSFARDMALGSVIGALITLGFVTGVIPVKFPTFISSNPGGLVGGFVGVATAEGIFSAFQTAKIRSKRRLLNSLAII